MAEPFRALIIDDDPDLVSLIKRTLEFTAGWQVQTAHSGSAGIALARSALLWLLRFLSWLFYCVRCFGREAPLQRIH